MCSKYVLNIHNCRISNGSLLQDVKFRGRQWLISCNYLIVPYSIMAEIHDH